MNGKLSINVFHTSLQDDTNESQLLSALRRMLNAEAKQIREQKKIEPAPLGSWAGWGY